MASAAFFRFAQLVERFRWLFLPIGLFALVAMGVHAAADAVDDRILWAVDQLDAVFDKAFASWSVTERLVNVIGLEERTWFARAITFVWELAADAVIALPALSYREAPPKGRGWQELLERAVKRPTAARLLRPLATFPLILAGACAIARMVQGALFLSFHGGGAVAAAAAVFSRLLAILALGAVLASLGWRALHHSLQVADRLADEKKQSRLRRWSAGVAGVGLVAPLSLAALLEASALLSFFR